MTASDSTASRRAALAAFVRETVLQTVPDEGSDRARLPDGADAAVSSHGALYMQECLGGVIMGYFHNDNPSALLGEAEGGHDFLLVDGRFIVDLWGYDYDGRVPEGVLDLDDPRDAAFITALYGSRDSWVVTEPEQSTRGTAQA